MSLVDHRTGLPQKEGLRAAAVIDREYCVTFIPREVVAWRAGQEKTIGVVCGPLVTPRNWQVLVSLLVQQIVVPPSCSI